MSEIEIRSVMAPITGGELLIPNATVAEVVGYEQPEPIPDAPLWVLGNLLWRGWQVPVISFSALADLTVEEDIEHARLCITKCLARSDRLPYLAILTQGFPRLVTVTETVLTEVPQADLPDVIAGRVILGDREAWVPDLDQLARQVNQALHASVPLTT